MKNPETERCLKIIRDYDNWCNPWGEDRNLAVAQQVALEIAEHIEDTAPNIKPLVWKEPSHLNNYVYNAKSLWGTYYIHICGGRHQAWIEKWGNDEDIGPVVGSVLEAQILAENHYINVIKELIGLENE